MIKITIYPSNKKAENCVVARNTRHVTICHNQPTLVHGRYIVSEIDSKTAKNVFVFRKRFFPLL